MALFLTIVFCVLLKISSGFCCKTPCNCNNNNKTFDYYWRDYFGNIPYDAVQGGIDKNGNPSYIGQVYSKNHASLLPATIYSGCLSARASVNGAPIELDDSIKILCSNKKNKLAWIPTQNNKTSLLINCHLVVGGFESEHILNIGRVTHNGQVVIGKVFSYPLWNSGLWIPDNNSTTNFLVYEILTYNCVN
ncbi:hypothetical protein RN001_010374 [Aquatica leii]|uniref:Uncharacterized protein n=1 Tax=Aquatica leii TaxID=1421715 RepID=A0AAN7P7T7_9COLE|nr:hypothetical protein RN001_010374 [Aquatica leii]